ncbi:hypothetical protein DFH09DRAFT_1312424 [Mycena vulgaris]|nr:hypothetical protein DFH09DRAFT_1312424 [Mycena vulgaris]
MFLLLVCTPSAATSFSIHPSSPLRPSPSILCSTTSALSLRFHPRTFIATILRASRTFLPIFLFLSLPSIFDLNPLTLLRPAHTHHLPGPLRCFPSLFTVTLRCPAFALAARSRLVILGAEDVNDADDTDADDERGREIAAEKDREKEFLPRLTHLHAPPALAARISHASFLAPRCLPRFRLSRKRRRQRPQRQRHNVEVEALAGKILTAERAGQGRPVPVLSLSDAEAKEEVVRAGVVKGRKVTAGAVYVRPPGPEGGASVSGDGREGRAALRVLRIAVARLMYEAGAGTGGARVGRAVGGMLARASGLPVHRHGGVHAWNESRVMRATRASSESKMSVQRGLMLIYHDM